MNELFWQVDLNLPHVTKTSISSMDVMVVGMRVVVLSLSLRAVSCFSPGCLRKNVSVSAPDLVKVRQAVLCLLLCVLEFGQSLRAVGSLLNGGVVDRPSRPFDWTEPPLSGLKLCWPRPRGEERSLTDYVSGRSTA